MRPAVRVLGLVGVLTIGSVIRTDASSTGGISGRITYLGGQPVPRIAVYVCSPAEVAVAMTSSRGFYSFVSLSPGRYVMQFVTPTKQLYQYNGVRVTADDTTTENPTVCPPDMICDAFGQPPLQTDTSADVGNFDWDDTDSRTSCGPVR